MALRYTLVETNDTDVPGAAAVNANRGFNIPGGSVDEIIMKCSFRQNAVGDVDGDTSNLLNQLRLVLNGETVFDYTALVSSAGVATPGTFGYFLNSLGQGRSLDVPAGNLADTKDREFYARIPIGRVVPPGVSRLEYSLGWTASAGATTNKEIQFWIRYNDAMQTTTTVANATSFTYTATTQQVVARLPQNVSGKIAGILIQTNNGTADEIDSIRLTSQSDFSMDVDMWRNLNGDLHNGILAYVPGTDGSQSYFTECIGQYFIPTYLLDMRDDLRMTVTANAGGTLSVTPVIVAPVSGKPKPEQVQTQAVPTNVGTAVLDDSASKV